MRFFITGASGFIGQYLIAYIQNTDSIGEHYIEGLFCNQDEDKLIPIIHGHYLKGDISEPDAIANHLITTNPDIVIHLAGKNKGHFDDLTRVNILGTYHFLHLVKEHTPHARTVFMSSSAVYGYTGTDPISEDHPLGPLSDYGITKTAAELIAQRSFRVNKIPITIIRPFNVIGPGQSPEYAIGKIAHQIAMLLQNKIKTIYVGNLYPERDYLDVRDLVRGIFEIGMNINFHTNFVGKPFNIGSGSAHSLYDMFQIITRIYMQFIPIVESDPNWIDPIPIQVADISRIHNLTGWTPLYTLEQSLKDIISYTESQSIACTFK